ncbi:hypothetical protein OH76DRAFT_1490457 [Lentinus brumalis]|uniref:Uncharacterized protein n=1 Tax=Lentinus brumalis TaxID=2498619 RepID=A0A371CIY8_9APHY|nr:hypothetical protein OH76DRAFT_1490457 [Polyporus brumalis]
MFTGGVVPACCTTPWLPLDNPIWQFTTETLRNLDRAIKEHYDEWWQGAPDSYRVPEFIDAEPVAILAKYGQNIKICAPATFEADRDTWNDMIDFNNILRIHMAYAVHTQAIEASGFEPIDPQRILDRYTHVYTIADPNTRELIEDLENYDLLDGGGREIPISSEDGLPILRRDRFRDPDTPPCGLLQDLNKVLPLFQESSIIPLQDPELDDRERELQDEDFIADILGDPSEPMTPIFTYPQFFSKNIGQWQADGVIKPLLHPLRRLARDIGITADGPLCIEGFKSQAYNNRGPLTGATAGAWARDATTKKTALDKLGYASVQLPHEHLARQMCTAENHASKNALCFENNFIFHIARIKPEYCSGGGFYEHVLMKLRKIFFSPEVNNALRSSTVIFKPAVYPRILEWTTYPITTLLDRV